MKTLAWVENTRRAIKSYHGFGWSIQGIEKQNKVLTKFVYRFPTGQRTTVLTQLEDKKLLQSKKRSEPEKGIVKFFFPPE